MENASRRIWKWSRTSGKNASVAWPPRPEPNKNDNAPNKNDNNEKRPSSGPSNWPRNCVRWVSTRMRSPIVVPFGEPVDAGWLARFAAQRFQHQRMQRSITGQSVGCIGIERRAINVGDDAAGLADQHHAAGYIPDVIVERPITIEPSGGQIRQVERRRAGAAQRTRPQREMAKPLQCSLLTAQVRRKTRGQQRFLQTRRPARVQ